MKFRLEIELTDEMLTGADIVYSLQDSFRGEAKLALETGVGGVLWTRTGNTVGNWEVVADDAEVAADAVFARRLEEIIGGGK